MNPCRATKSAQTNSTSLQISFKGTFGNSQFSGYSRKLPNSFSQFLFHKTCRPPLVEFLQTQSLRLSSVDLYSNPQLDNRRASRTLVLDDNRSIYTTSNVSFSTHRNSHGFQSRRNIVHFWMRFLEGHERETSPSCCCQVVFGEIAFQPLKQMPEC